MAPHFNDSRRQFELTELCAHCGKRNGVHSMSEKCPVLAPNGVPIVGEFSKQKFAGSGKHEQD
jgi:hypothetical protein